MCNFVNDQKVCKSMLQGKTLNDLREDITGVQKKWLQNQIWRV